MFYGRTKEFARLEKECLKENPFAAIYGTPRIGKTSLISELVKDKKLHLISLDDMFEEDD